MVVACLALLVALSGTGVSAVSQLVPRNSVGTAQLKRNAVTPRKLAPNAVRTGHVLNGSLLAADFKEGQIPAGPQGPAGAQGPAGPAGEPATRLWAKVSSTGALLTASGATAASRTATGFFDVTFNRSVAECMPLATLGADAVFYIPRPIALTVSGSTVRVRIIDVSGAASDAGFYLGVFC
jgi:hypothetical protein